MSLGTVVVLDQARFLGPWELSLTLELQEPGSGTDQGLRYRSLPGT